MKFLWWFYISFRSRCWRTECCWFFCWFFCCFCCFCCWNFIFLARNLNTPIRSFYPSILSRYIPDTYPTHTRYIRISHEYPTNTPRMLHEYPKQGIFMTHAHAREPYLYTRAYARALLISVSTLFVIIDNQLITKKMMLYNIFLAQKFGRSKKKQYLCARFAPEVSEPQQ